MRVRVAPDGRPRSCRSTCTRTSSTFWRAPSLRAIRSRRSFGSPWDGSTRTACGFAIRRSTPTDSRPRPPSSEALRSEVGTSRPVARFLEPAGTRGGGRTTPTGRGLNRLRPFPEPSHSEPVPSPTCTAVGSLVADARESLHGQGPEVRPLELRADPARQRRRPDGLEGLHPPALRGRHVGPPTPGRDQGGSGPAQGSRAAGQSALRRDESLAELALRLRVGLLRPRGHREPDQGVPGRPADRPHELLQVPGEPGSRRVRERWPRAARRDWSHHVLRPCAGSAEQEPRPIVGYDITLPASRARSDGLDGVCGRSSAEGAAAG